MKKLLLLLSVVSLATGMDKKKKNLERMPSFVGSEPIEIPSEKPQSPKAARSYEDNRRPKIVQGWLLENEVAEKQPEPALPATVDARRPKIPYNPTAQEKQNILQGVIGVQAAQNPPMIKEKAKSESSIVRNKTYPGESGGAGKD